MTTFTILTFLLTEQVVINSTINQTTMYYESASDFAITKWN